MDGVVGVKSGYTSEAGGCDVMTINYTLDGTVVTAYAVVLGQQGGNALEPLPARSIFRPGTVASVVISARGQRRRARASSGSVGPGTCLLPSQPRRPRHHDKHDDHDLHHVDHDDHDDHSVVTGSSGLAVETRSRRARNRRWAGRPFSLLLTHEFEMRPLSAELDRVERRYRVR
jgi:hypothetical protein